MYFIFFFSSRRRHTRWPRDWSSDVCSSDLEVLLMKIFKRVKKLCENGYEFQLEPVHFTALFAGDVSVEQYLRLDETIVHYYFQQWQKENDFILWDLCSRFFNRRLFKYIHFVSEKQLVSNEY